MQRLKLPRRSVPSPSSPAVSSPSHDAPHIRSQLQSCKTLLQFRSLLARLLVAGLIRHPLTLCNLVEFLALSRQSAFLLHARLLVDLNFDVAPSSSTFLYNTLIKGFSNTASPAEALAAFSRMLRSSLKPDNFTFPLVLKASSVLKSVEEGTQIHDQIIKRGFATDVFVVSTLMRFYSGIGKMGSAKRVFDTSPCLDVVSYTTLIDGYVKCGEVEIARQLFDEMPERNAVSWSAMISGYVRKGELDAAQSLFDRMPVEKDTVTWNLMISGFARSGLLPVARKLFDEMPEKNVVSWNSMISGYAQCGELKYARKLFDKMPERDVFSWSCMISGYAQGNHYKEALELFKEMQMENRTRPNEITMVSVLSVCAQLAALEQGKWVHAYIDKNGMRLTGNLGAALIDMYAKCGRVETALELFCKLDERNISAWNAIITGLAINGVSHKSIEIFEEMQCLGIKPNDITFMGVLMACTHGGLVEEGRKQFESMSKTYGIEPELKHYGCIVDLLGRAGLLDEAEEIIRSMPIKPDEMILGALLGACKIYGNIEIADRVGRDFLELKSTEAGCHVLLSNIYASAGRCAEALEMRNVIDRNGIKKEPGSSSYELNGTVYEFKAGDRSHHQTGDIYLWLDDMGRKLKSEGYSPITADVLVDLDEEDKEMCLSHHSEKLALAFAMINVVAGSIICIVKNLRICGDCHLFIKHVSKLYKREIIVRDRTRFHHFNGGSCSCGDYW